jgi:hypothetical protein
MAVGEVTVLWLKTDSPQTVGSEDKNIPKIDKCCHTKR